MQAITEKSNDKNTGKRFRLVVQSAEEAVRIIRDKLGDNAKVLSVRQIGGEGLKRFISSPKLEVIAEVQSWTPGQSDDQHSALKSMRQQRKPLTPSPMTAVSNTLQTSKARHERWSNCKVIKVIPRLSWENWLDQLLHEYSLGPTGDSTLPLADALKHITVGLSDRYRSTEKKATTNKIALLGSPGVGKTTTLCKFLAHEVFMNKTTPKVLKVESGVPNPDDALRIFCEVVGVTLYRQQSSIDEWRIHPHFIWTFPVFPC